MIIDGRTIPNGTQKTTQVCIVGSGQAGITAAWQLQKAGIKVILIEGSRVYNTVSESWPDKVLLYNGVSDGLFKTNEPEFLILPYVTHQNTASERERMSSDPTLGVVDKNLKVHSLKNLYVAGSSVFPSGGISNPTFTIITLSIRLADYLRQQLTGA